MIIGKEYQVHVYVTGTDELKNNIFTPNLP